MRMMPLCDSAGIGGVVIAVCLLLVCKGGLAAPDTTEVYEYVLSWGGPGSEPGQFSGACGMGSDRYGNLYVCDLHNHRVQKFDSLGNFLMMFGEYGTEPGQFQNIVDVAVDQEGYIYVTDYDRGSWNPSWVQKFDSLGNFLLRWGGESGLEPGELRAPRSIAIGDSGYVYVADSGDRIQRFTPQGDFDLIWTHPDATVHGGDVVGTYPGSVYTEWATGEEYLFRHDPTGNIILSFSSMGPDSGQVGYPYDVATDSEGSLYVGDWGIGRVSKFDSLGNFITMWGQGGPQPWSPMIICGIAIDFYDAVYVTDWSQNRVYKYRRTLVSVGDGPQESLDQSIGFRLQQNYPNPFSVQTVIGYVVADGAVESWTTGVEKGPELTVQLEVFNLLGQRVRTLMHEQQSRGEYRVVWDGRSDEGRSVGSGIYTYQFRSGNTVLRRRCVLVR